jgi:hypothetical protein
MADSTNSSTISPEIEYLERGDNGASQGVAFLTGKAPMGLILPMSWMVLYAPEARRL